MPNAFDQFDAQATPAAANPFDAFDDVPSAQPQVAQPKAEEAPEYNVVRGAIERGGQLLGGLFTAGNAAAEGAEKAMPLGGLVWDGGVFPTYLSGKEYTAFQQNSGHKEPLEVAGDYWNKFDTGYVPTHTWESVKKEFEDGPLKASAWGEVLAYGAEQGVKSTADMAAAIAALPAYVIARSGEIGTERAKNKGKERADLVDVAEAAPFALGSALLERIGAKGITQAGAEELGKEALKQGMGNAAKRIGAAGAKAGGKEAATEFVQEGVIEYIGERFGTGAAMSVAEAFDRGAAGAVAGGVYGAGAGAGSAAVNERAAAHQETQAAPVSDAPPVLTEDVDQSTEIEEQARAEIPQATGNPFDIFVEAPATNPFDAFDTSERAIDTAANEAATSPANDAPQPSQGQKEAGNYRKGHVAVAGLDIAIENPRGSVREGVDRDGKKWSNTINDHYGYFKRTEGKDGDQVDVFIGQQENPTTAWVIDQVDPASRRFDEHKVMLGYANEVEARAAYQANYAEDWDGIGGVTEMPVAQLKDWLRKGDTRARLSKNNESRRPPDSVITSDPAPADAGVFRSGETEAMPKTITVGPMTQKIKPVGGKLFRETSPERLSDLLREVFSNSPERGAVTHLFVTDDQELAIGQGKNKGALIEMDGNYVSGEVREKPGTGVIGGQEFVADYINRNAIRRITLPAGVKLRGPARIFANREFDKRTLEDGRTELTRKDTSVAYASSEALGYDIVSSEGSFTPLDVQGVREAVDPILRDLGQEVQAVKSWRDLPEAGRRKAQSLGAENWELVQQTGPLADAIREANALPLIPGMLIDNTYYAIADFTTDPEMAQRAAIHELVGHKGVFAVLGERARPTFEQIAQDAVAQGGRRVLVTADGDSLEQVYGLSFDTPADRAELGAEYVAHLAEKGEQMGLVQSVVSKVRRWLRELFPALTWTRGDILDLLKRSRRALKAQGRPVDHNRDSGAAAEGLDNGATDGEVVPPETSPPLARVGPIPENQPFGPPSDTVLRRAVSKIADKFTVLKGIQENIREQSGDIDESQDAYRAEELFHGKVENDLRLIREQMLEPLSEKMAEYDIGLEALDRYLYAIHAPERNRVIAQRNPKMPDGGSGMTNAEAAQIIQEVAEAGALGQYQELAGRVHAMLERRRDLLRKAGLEDSETLGAWEATYRHYVPLKGWAVDEAQDGLPRAGKGFAISGRESQMAGGRRSKAASPTATTISDLTEAVIRKRKNEVGNTFLSLIEANPNPDYWQVFTDERPEVQRKPVKVRDPETGGTRIEVREQTVPMAMMTDRYFTTKRDGETHYINLEDPRLMRAMRNLGPEDNHVLIRGLASITRIMSALNTSYNPEFTISNFSRDIQTALLNLKSEQSSDGGKARGAEIAGKTLKNTGTAIRAIHQSLRGKAAQTPEMIRWHQAFDQFRANGAKTGWFDMKDIDGQARELETLINMANGSVSGRIRRGWNAFSEVVENANQAIENGVRLSAYVNAIEAGIPRSQAASLAKNMTVNFNRRGELGTTLNAVYMFANASIQGTANFVRTLGRLNGRQGDRLWRRMNAAQKIAAGMAVGGFMLSLLNRLVAGEDDDGVNWWEKVPNYIKERNLVLMKSAFGGEPGEYWTIPLPYGYNIFPVMGHSLEDLLNSDKSTAKIASHVVLAALGSFSPIGFQESSETYGAIIKNITPTVLRPVADISLNENFFGGPIFKENYPFGVQKPDSALAFRSTPEIYKAIAEGLNEATGGSEFRPGAADVSPGVLEYLVGYYGGGAYDFFTGRLPNFAHKAATGTEMEWREIPFVRKGTGAVLPYEDQSKFYERRNEILQYAEEMKHLRGRERSAFVRENRALLRLQPMIKATEKRLKTLRGQRDRIELQDLSTAEKNKRLNDVERRMKQTIDRFNRRYNEAD